MEIRITCTLMYDYILLRNRFQLDAVICLFSTTYNIWGSAVARWARARRAEPEGRLECLVNLSDNFDSIKAFSTNLERDMTFIVESLFYRKDLMKFLRDKRCKLTGEDGEILFFFFFLNPQDKWELWLQVTRIKNGNWIFFVLVQLFLSVYQQLNSSRIFPVEKKTDRKWFILVNYSSRKKNRILFYGQS